MNTLDKIQKPNDIKRLEKSEYRALASDIRSFLLEHVSKTGGHLASNLGAVELTMALHLVLDFPVDKLIWDVGHQSYTHKILTGRKKDFDTLRQLGGMSGFPKRNESNCDSFDTGHSSTSISAALGLAEAKELRGTDETIVAVIGDGALSGGLAFEALNNAARLKSSMLIVLNDNEMSISKNVGGLSKYLNKIRVGQAYNELKAGIENTLLNIPKAGQGIAKTVKRSKDSIKQLLLPGMFFEDMGITYIGPIDGHNIETMVDTFVSAIELQRPVVVHVKTKKGKGYRYAEKYPSYFHGVAPFEIENGRALKKKTTMTYTDVFARKLIALGEQYPQLLAITAAMPQGTGLHKFQEIYPERFFDVGIAEEHAVTFAAGLAVAGMIPIVAVYSSFLQRAYDQILHDVCIQKLHVIFAIDRSGLVGADGATHQGIFDTAFLRNMPNMTVIAPKNRYELTKAMEYAIEFDGPVAIKYPRGNAFYELKEYQMPFEQGKSEPLILTTATFLERKTKGVALLAVGNMMEEAIRVQEMLQEKKIPVSLYNARFVCPIDTQLIAKISQEYACLCVMEEGIKSGGYGEGIAAELCSIGARIDYISIAIPDQFVEHGDIPSLRRMLKMDAESVLDRIMKVLQ